MFGGFNVFGNAAIVKKTFRFALPHNKIKITGKYHILDAWNLNENDQF